MPTTRWNKIDAPVNADAYNPTGDMQGLADDANIIVPVASAAERDGLTPPGGKYAGMMSARTDLAGVPIQRYTGSVWTGGLAAVVTGNGTQVFNDGISTVVQFANLITDVGGMTNLVSFPSRVTIAAPGRYDIVGGGGFSTGAATGRLVGWLRKNGVDVSYGGDCDPITNQGVLSEYSVKAAVTLDLLAGDYVELVMQQSTGFAQSSQANPWNRMYLSVVQVG